MDEISQQAHAALAMVDPLPCRDGSAMMDTTPAIEPVVVQYTPTKTIAMKTDEVVHLALDSKLKDPVKLGADLEQLDLMRWAKFVSCLKEKQVKVDTTITAMGIFALFPVAMQDKEM